LCRDERDLHRLLHRAPSGAHLRGGGRPAARRPGGGGGLGLHWGRLTAMIGPLLIIVVLVVALPIAFIITGGVISVILGQSLAKEGEYLNEGSELIDLNV